MVEAAYFQNIKAELTLLPHTYGPVVAAFMAIPRNVRDI